jgi:dienelactone hydrolase
MEIVTERTQIPVGREDMGGYLARPADGKPRPGVLVFMEIFGVNAHIRDVTERIAREGYVALAPNYFHRSAPASSRLRRRRACRRAWRSSAAAGGRDGGRRARRARGAARAGPT